MPRQAFWTSIQAMTFLSLPLLALSVAQPAKAAEPMCLKIKYTVSVCVEKKGQGIEIYSTLLGGRVTTQKQYLGLDGGTATFGTVEVFGTKAQVQAGARRNPLRVEAQAEACFRNNCTKRTIVYNLNSDGAPTSASDTADPNVQGLYQLYWDGQQVGVEPNWTRAQAIRNLENNKKAYPDKKVEGFFNGNKLGYELYWDGKRVGFEPSWNRAQAIRNLEDNKKAYANDMKVEGFLNGNAIGYELFWDGKRAGFEPSWTRAQAIRNLEDNKKAYPDKKVEGFLDGQKVGYELYFDGQRVGFEPGWDRDRALNNLRGNIQRYPNIKVEAILDGAALKP